STYTMSASPSPSTSPTKMRLGSYPNGNLGLFFIWIRLPHFPYPRFGQYSTLPSYTRTMSCIPSPVMSANLTRWSEKFTFGKSSSACRSTQRTSSGFQPEIGSLKKHSIRLPDRNASVTPSPSRSISLTSGSSRLKLGAKRYRWNDLEFHFAGNSNG